VTPSIAEAPALLVLSPPTASASIDCVFVSGILTLPLIRYCKYRQVPVRLRGITLQAKGGADETERQGTFRDTKEPMTTGEELETIQMQGVSEFADMRKASFRSRPETRG